jgi:ATP-binding cassette subfamily B protein
MTHSNSDQIQAGRSVRFFVRHAWRYKLFLIGTVLAVPLASLTLYYIPPLIIADILKRIELGDFVAGELWASFGASLSWYAVLTILGGVIMWRVAIFFIWKLEMHVLRDIHREVFAHLMRLGANFHANRFGGSLVSQANKLAGAYVRFADTMFFELFTLLLSFAFSFAILLPRVPWIAIALLSFSIIFMILAVKLTGKVRELRSREAAAETRQTGFLADAVTNVMAVKSFAGSRYENERYNEATTNTLHATHKVMVASSLRDTVFSISTVAIGIAALTMAVAAMVVFNADIGTGFLVITYTGIIGQRLWDFAQSMVRNLNRAFGDAQEMMDILAIKPEVEDFAEVEVSRISKGGIKLQNVDFTHPDSSADETLFRGLNLTVKPGEKIGLVGHSGSGKTTLTKILLRFHDIDGGSITIDGQDIFRLRQDDLRRNIAYVPQEPLLFHRTIRENIAYGNPSATDQQIKEAAKKAYADEFIEKLPKGYETLVGERGVKLSGGQRQRVAIARAILKNAPILVLDEATSALDSESEKAIQAALWELMKERTALVIAHRLSTIQRMDRIVVLEDGTIVEEGTHGELLKKQGTYATLWSHQSGGFIEE